MTITDFERAVGIIIKLSPDSTMGQMLINYAELTPELYEFLVEHCIETSRKKTYSYWQFNFDGSLPLSEEIF